MHQPVEVTQPQESPKPPPRAVMPRTWAQEVERHGRRIKTFRAASLVVGATLLLTYFAADVGANTSSFTSSGAFRVLVLMLVALVLVLGVRVLASRHYEAGLERVLSEDPDEKPLPPPAPEGLVICCSGGGIKSAAFCLGGLEGLVDRDVYTRAHTVVGVSGGGYMAAAFAVLRARMAAQQPPVPAQNAEPTPVARLVIPREWVASRRRLTNYLASSARVRYDLVNSWLFGVAVNIVIIAFAMAAVGWVATEIGLFSGLLDAPLDGKPWDIDIRHRSWWWWLLLPVVLCLVSFLHFLVLRFFRDTWLAANAASGRGWRPNLTVGTTIEDRQKGEFAAWSSNLPNALVTVAVMYTVVLVLAPVAAVAVHNGVAALDTTFWGYLQVRAAAVVVAVLGYVGTVRSAFVGLRPSSPTGVLSQALDLFRKRMAPVIALLLYLAGLFLAAVLIDAYLLSRDWARHNAAVWLVAVGVLVFIRCVGTANQTSMFPFYRDRLQAAYLAVDDGDQSPSQPRPDPAQLSLESLEELKLEPRLVLCGTANVRDQNLLPTGRNGTPFILSEVIGLTDEMLPGRGCLPPIKEYMRSAQDRQVTIPASLKDREPFKRVDPPLRALNSRMTSPIDVASKLTVADAVAISGAALSPVDGRDSKTFGRYRVLLAMANLRTGVWLPNPYWVVSGKFAHIGFDGAVRLVDDWLDASSPYHVIQEAVGSPSVYSPHLYVTDGGHYDNLGLVEALRRRPATIIMLDGSGDAEDEFPTMGNAMATARMDLGVEIDFDPTPMVRGDAENPARAWVRVNATYADKSPCEILYVKSVLPADASWDLQSYQKQHPDFPATSQTYEMYDEFDFEAFRQLGYWVVGDALRWP